MTVVRRRRKRRKKMSGFGQWPPILQFVTVGVPLGIAGYFGWDWYKKRKEEEKIEYQRKQTATGTNASGKKVTVNLANAANEIYDAFYNYGGGEDEERAIRVFKSIPVLYIKQLETVYNTLHNKNLRDDFAKYLSDVQFIGVKYFFK